MFRHLDDKTIAEELFKKNPLIVDWFFGFYKPLFIIIIKYVAGYYIDYREFRNAFFLYLVEVPKTSKTKTDDNGDPIEKTAPIQTFTGTGSLKNWMKVTAINYLRRHLNEFIDDHTKEDETSPFEPEPTNPIDSTTARMDLEELLQALPKTYSRHAYVIRRICLDGIKAKDVAKELGTTTTNVYNLKKRGIDELKNLGKERGL